VWARLLRISDNICSISAPFYGEKVASIRKRGDFQYEARIRRKGAETICKTFNNKADAEKWALLTEAELARGMYLPRRDAERITIEELAASLPRQELEVQAKAHHRRNGKAFHRRSDVAGCHEISRYSPFLP
jgi:hypothetical protein